MKIKKGSAKEVLRELSPTSRKLLWTMFGVKKGVAKIGADEFIAVLELIAKGILRADRSLLTHEYLVVLERGGKWVLEEMKREKERESQ